MNFRVWLRIAKSAVADKLIKKKTRSETGLVYHRKFWMEFHEPRFSPMLLIKKFQEDPNHFSNLSEFEKTKGLLEKMNVGDEFMLHIKGPWDEPLTVVDVKDNSCTFETREGHMETGTVNFRAEETSPGRWRFTVETIARNKDPLQLLNFEKLTVAKMGSTRLWKDVCEKFTDLCSPKKKERVVTEKSEKGEWIRE